MPTTASMLFEIARPSLPLYDSTGRSLESRWPINRIFCIGRNYADHAREMGHDPEREPPFYFAKPATAYLPNGAAFTLPHYSQQVDYEVEVVIGLRHGGRQLTQEAAEAAVGGIGIGLDMTCRDIQKDAKRQGRPWELAKGFDQSAPMTGLQLLDLAQIQARYGEFALTRNQETVQQGQIRDMIWDITGLIMQISQNLELQPGDIIMTGTPSGVGPVKAGDQLNATLAGFCEHLHTPIIAQA